MNKTDKNAELQASLKSADTEEWIDMLFYRPIGYWWAVFFRHLGVSPNAITIASIFLGIAAGVLFYFSELWINIIGMALLVWANMYDSADGQLARMTGQKSELGRILDGVCGDLWFISIYVALCLRMMPEWSYTIWILAAVAGFFHSKQASMADYYRNIHLFFLKGKSGSELDNSIQQKEIYRTMVWKGNFFRKVFQWFYCNYTQGQEQLSPKFQRFFAVVKQRYGSEAVDAELCNQFRQVSLPLMKYTNILSFNTRVFVLFISLIVNFPWIYFIFELTVLNVILIYMVHKHESWSNYLYKQIQSK